MGSWMRTRSFLRKIFMFYLFLEIVEHQKDLVESYSAKTPEEITKIPTVLRKDAEIPANLFRAPKIPRNPEKPTNF